MSEKCRWVEEKGHTYLIPGCMGTVQNGIEECTCQGMMDSDVLMQLRILADDDFDQACEWAENNVPELKSFFDTWSMHCGASRKVFIGHTIKTLINL